MHRILPVAAALALSACAHDSYTVPPNQAAAYPADLHTCKTAAVHEVIHRNNVGIAPVFGLVGSAVQFATDPSEFTEPQKPFDVKVAVEDCMKARGYAANQDDRP